MADPVIKDFSRAREPKDSGRFGKWGGTVPGAFILIILTVLAEHFGDFLWDQVKDPFAEIHHHSMMLADMSTKLTQAATWQQNCDATLTRFDNRLSVVESKTNSIEGKMALLTSNLQSRINNGIKRAHKEGYAQGASKSQNKTQSAYSADGLTYIIGAPPPHIAAWANKPGD